MVLVGDHGVRVGRVWFLVVVCMVVVCIQVGCMVGSALRGGRHRSWRIRRPAAARQSVLSELEPRARTKHPASLLAGMQYVWGTDLLGVRRWIPMRYLYCQGR